MTRTGASGSSATVIATCTTITVVHTPPKRRLAFAACSRRSESWTLSLVTRSAGSTPTITAATSVSSPA